MEGIISLVVGFLVLFIAFTFIINCFTFLFLYIDYHLGILSKPAEYTPWSMRYFIRNFFKEYLLIMAKFVLLPWRFRSIDSRNLADTQPEIAILLIHGYGRNQSDWLCFLKRFYNTHYPVHALNLHPMIGQLPEIAKSVLPTVQQLKQQYQPKKIVLIGHSMGGLIASYYSEYLDIEHDINAVITIGSPLQGTKIAFAGFSPNAAQMCPQSDFLKGLSQKIQKSEKSYFHVASKYDNMIFPWQSSIRGDYPIERQHILPYESHLGLIYSANVFEKIQKWLLEV